MCTGPDRNSDVTNIFKEETCKLNELKSIRQAFNQSFWNDPRRQKARSSDWLDCASLNGKNDYFVNFLNQTFH
jgi:hypothetical protein